MQYSLLIRLAIVGASLAALGGQSLAQDPPSAAGLARRFARHFDERPPVLFELETTGERPGRILITNTYQQPLTAVAIEISGEPGGKMPPQTQLYDAFTRSALRAPVPQGLTFTAFAGHIVGGPIPNAKLVAAIWEDGSTFGSEDILNRLLESRRATLSAFDNVLSILQTGMDSGWTAPQFLSALDVARPPNLVPITMDQVQIQASASAVSYGARLTISSLADKEKFPRGVVALQKGLTKQRDQLANSAPALSENSPGAQK